MTTTDLHRLHASMVTRRAVAHQLGISIRTLDRIVARGDLPSYRVAGVVRFDQEDVDAFIERCRIRSTS